MDDKVFNSWEGHIQKSCGVHLLLYPIGTRDFAKGWSGWTLKLILEFLVVLWLVCGIHIHSHISYGMMLK